jgi:RNA polymerase sigma factor (sigma-70 family)
METEAPPAPPWAAQILCAVHRLQSAAPAEADAARARLWSLLHAALFGSLRAQAGRIARFSREDLEDVASTKALELLRQAESRKWSTDGRHAGEVGGFLLRVAHNGLVDLARSRSRETAPAEMANPNSDGAMETEDPSDVAATREFVASLERCVAELQPRARDVWYRAAVLDRPSRETAAALGLTVGNVDVIAQRTRAALVACMGRSGHRSTEVSPRAFVRLWANAASRWLSPRGEQARSAGAEAQR